MVTIDKNSAPGVYVAEIASSAPIAGVGTSIAGFIGVMAVPAAEAEAEQVELQANAVGLCTNFAEFKKLCGDFSATDADQSLLAHAVYGFFRNGGTRCYIGRAAAKNAADVQKILAQFEAIDEIAIVAAPGITDKVVLNPIIEHCEAIQDRVAILDSKLEIPDQSKLDPTVEANALPKVTNYAAFYFPWIQVFDPATKTLIYVPPSGHMAGLYARVDSQRGVHKAPANEVLVGAEGLKYAITRNQQGVLNGNGINCIRSLNGNIRVWGARSFGPASQNGEFTYINVRRLFNYLRESIDEGTQWTVFEPNSPELWARIRRTIIAFLTTVWRSGALFGNTPEEAFYVKCDEETNPKENRDRGIVTTEIGVAVVKPAEFVIFNLSHWSGGKS
jgi:uncharacterized protein